MLALKNTAKDYLYYMYMLTKTDHIIKEAEYLWARKNESHLVTQDYSCTSRT